MNPMAPSVDMLRGAPSLTALSGADESRIRQTAQQFEATFMAQMLRPMFEGLSTEAPFGGGHVLGTPCLEASGLLGQTLGQTLGQGGQAAGVFGGAHAAAPSLGAADCPACMRIISAMT